LLLEAGSDVLATNCYGQGALGDSSFCGHVAVVRELLRWKADVHSRNEENYSPLIMAAQMGQTECMRELLLHGALTEAPVASDGQEALEWAENFGYMECAALLREAGVETGVETGVGQGDDNDTDEDDDGD